MGENSEGCHGRTKQRLMNVESRQQYCVMGCNDGELTVVGKLALGSSRTNNVIVMGCV